MTTAGSTQKRAPYVITAARPLSWSAISSFEYSPEQWYKRYVLAQQDPPSPEMIFGKEVGERLASDPKFLPQVPRAKFYEFEQPDGLQCTFNKIPLIGFIDSYTPHTLLYEYKTGRKAWDQARADSHGQIDMYLWMLWLKHKVRPEKVLCHILWLPTKSDDDVISFVDEHDVKSFETKRTMADILRFGQRINKVYAEMQRYADNHA